jgi:hypothetical protein
MNSVEGPPFPNIMPSSIILSHFHAYQQGDIGDEEDLQALFSILYYHPEITAYYFCAHGENWDTLLIEAEARGEIIISITENFFFRHPTGRARDFVRIEERHDNYEFEWERNVVAAGPMYSRSTLILSAQKRLSLETWQKIHMEDEYREIKLANSSQYDVFLSYSSHNSTEARTVSDAIIGSGKRVFLAEKSIQPGHDFEDAIRKALRGSREVWLLVSPQSMKSEWVTTEWGAAWALEKKIIPILFRCDSNSLPDRLKRIHCVDFHCYNELIKSLEK